MANCNVDVSANKIDKKAIAKEASILIRRGKTKQEAFEQLKKQFYHAKAISKILTCIPTPKQKEKYKLLNYILFATLFLPFVFFLSQYNWGASLLYSVLLYAVIWVKPRLYIGITALSFIFSIIIIFILFFGEVLLSWVLLALLVLSLSSLFLSNKLEKKFCPKPKETREKYIDKQGAIRVRIIYTFAD
jgi:hypothetical protein